MKRRLPIYQFLLSIFLFVTFKSYSQPATNNLTVPDYFVSESESIIKGTFDGNKENTFVIFEKNNNAFEAIIIKETKNEITVRTPAVSGVYNLIVEDDGNNTFFECSTRIVSLELSVGKTNLLKGEKTELEIKVTGVKDYTKPVTVTVTNKSPDIVSLPGNIKETYILNNADNLYEIIKTITLTGIKRGAFNIEVELNPGDKMIDYDWEKRLKEFEKRFKNLDFTEDSENGADTGNKNGEKITGNNNKNIKKDNDNYRIKTSSKTKKSFEKSGSPKDSTTCKCNISSKIKHKPGNTMYELTKAMKDQKVAKAFREQGITFPKKDDNNFKGQNIPIVPGSAYATGYGDIVGGYANAVAVSMWGKKPTNGTFAPDYFSTDHLWAEAGVLGTHTVTISPAAGEWSLVIGVATVSASTQANAVDPLDFERKLMKEFDRGKGVVKGISTIYGIIFNPIGDLIETIADAVLHITGGHKWINKRKSTSTDVKATARTDYFVSVNNSKKEIHKQSYAYRRAEIVRPTFKDTKIVKHRSSKNLEKYKTGKITVSSTHPTKVTAKITGAASLYCYATENGFSESGVASGTAVCIAGFCVDKNGAFKMDYIFDSGVFVLRKKGKEIADRKTEELRKEIDSYFNNLENSLTGKSAGEIKQKIKSNVESDLSEILNIWQSSPM